MLLLIVAHGSEMAGNFRASLSETVKFNSTWQTTPQTRTSVSSHFLNYLTWAELPAGCAHASGHGRRWAGWGGTGRICARPEKAINGRCGWRRG